MDDVSKKRYLERLNKKISEGFYTSDQIVSKIVEELAPVFNEHLDGDMSVGC